LATSIGHAIQTHVDQYATWIEREVSRNDQPLKTASDTKHSGGGMGGPSGKEAGLGTVSYVVQCMKTLKGEHPTVDEIKTAVKETAKMTDWRNIDWKKQQFEPLVHCHTECLMNGESPLKTPAKGSDGTPRTNKRPNPEPDSMDFRSPVSRGKKAEKSPGSKRQKKAASRTPPGWESPNK
jgi:hypothetical protein